MNLNGFHCVIFIVELLLLKHAICAPTVDSSTTKLEDKTADTGPTKGDSVQGPTKGDSVPGPTKGDSVSGPTKGDSVPGPTKSDTNSESGNSKSTSGSTNSAVSKPTKSDSASFSSSLDIKMDTSSSNSFQTIDAGGAEVIVASDQLNNAQENVKKVGSTVKLEATGNAGQAFSDSISISGSALDGTGTGQAVSVNSDTSGTKESFDAKADLFNVETIKTVESTSKADVVKPDTSGVETLKVADSTKVKTETKVEVQAPETLKTVEEKAVQKALESGTLGMPVDLNMFSVADDSNIDTTLSDSPLTNEFLDTSMNDEQPPMASQNIEEQRLILPNIEPPVLIRAPEPMMVSAALETLERPAISGFLDTGIHAAKRPPPARLAPPLDFLVEPDNSVSTSEINTEPTNTKNMTTSTTESPTTTEVSIKDSKVDAAKVPSSTVEQNSAAQDIKLTETNVSKTTVTNTVDTNIGSTAILQNQLDKSTSAGSSIKDDQFLESVFPNTPLNDFLKEGVKSTGREITSGRNNGDIIGTSTGTEIDWSRIIDTASGTQNEINNQQLSEFSRVDNTVQEQTIVTDVRNNRFDIQTTTVEPEFLGKPQPCAMTPHPDRSKFFMGSVPMQCPGSLIWKQTKCYCDYPGPEDKVITLPSLQNGGCDYLLKLGMENTYDNEFPQFRVESKSRRRRISFENVPGGNGLSAHIKRSPLIVNAFQGNDLTGTMHIKFRFRIANRRLNSRRLMILVSNGCGASWKGPQPPSIALKFIPRNTTFKLLFRTQGKNVVEFLQPQVKPRDGWYNVALYLQDEWLTFEVNGEVLYSSNGMAGSVVITPCPLKITGRTFEGYIDDFEFAKKCRYEPKVV